MARLLPALLLLIPIGLVGCDHSIDRDRDDYPISTDCDDTDPDVHPFAAEIADDGIDQDCNGFDTVTCWTDADGDSFGGAAQFDFDGDCADPGQVPNDDDCDDGDAAAYPFAPETADDGIDQDCNGVDATACWYDGDGDGYGDVNGPQIGLDGTCTAANLSPTSDDCDDGSPAIFPGAVEACDFVDGDCDGMVDHGALAAFLTPGGGDRISVPAFTTGTSAITVEAWVYPRAADWQPGPVVAKERSGAGEDVALGVDGGYLPTATVNGASGADTVLGGSAPAWVWTHLATTYDGSEQRLYVNGVLVAVSSGAGALSLDGTGTWSIGAGFDAAGLPVDHWYGAVDDVRVWSDVRTEAEIANTRCDAPDTSDPALLAWWPLEGDTLDETGNGNDGTAVGALSFFGR